MKEFYDKHRKVIVGCALGFLFLMLLVTSLTRTALSDADLLEYVPYNEFMQMVNEGKVDTVTYSTSNEKMIFSLFNDETRDMTDEERKDYEYSAEDMRMTLYPAYDEFRKDLLEKDVKLELASSVSAAEVISTLITLGLPVIFIFMMFSIMKNTYPALNKQDNLQSKSDVKFDQIIGLDEIIDDIRFVIKLIKTPTLGDDIGVKMPNGVLLVGPPGTGKTLIAKAIAGEADVPFLSISGSDFKELFVGMGAKRVRDLFAQARKLAPCVVFIDEIDSIGTKRDARLSSSEDDQTINALLKEMDGFTPKSGVFVIAATNHVEKLDSALVRSGRFDRQIVVNPPRNWKVRSDMFRYYLKNLKVADDVDIDYLSKQVSGFTGADIAAVCNEAGLIAVNKEKKCIDTECLEEAIDKKVFKGSRSKSNEDFKEDKKIVAYHEAGHAVATYLCGYPIARASIISNTSGVGGAVFGADTDSYFITDKELRDRVMIAYAGRASEQIKFNVLTTGAENDIQQATSIIVQYIERFGFDEDFGLLNLDIIREKNIINSDDQLKRISEMSKSLYDECVNMLKEKYSLVENVAEVLLDKETLSGEEVISVIEGTK